MNVFVAQMNIFCFSVVLLAKNKWKQNPRNNWATAPSCCGIKKLRYNIRTHLVTSALTDRCVSEKEPMNSIDYCLYCIMVLLKTFRKASMGYLLLCNFVLFWHVGVRIFPWDKKRAGSWLWLTAQNIETIIHWDHLCKKRNPEIFSPWGFSCKRLLLFVLILVCKFSLSFSVLAHTANYK